MDYKIKIIEMDNESRFSALNLVLPPATEPKGVYTPLLRGWSSNFEDLKYLR